MRADLTSAFQAELSRVGRAPVQLLAFFFPTAGTVRVSDRALGPADGLADDWAALVEDWGTLQDVVNDNDPAEITIEARQMSVTLINRGVNPFSDYFLKEDPEGVTVELYQWFAGLTDDDKVLIDRLVVADPIHFSERGRLVTLDLVSLAVNMDAIVGGLLSAADWPNAKADDVGKAIDVAFGTVGRLPTLCAKTAPEASLCGSVLADGLVLVVNEDLDALGFSAAGTIQIEEELIRYGSRTAAAFNVIQRGYVSTAVEHLDRVAIVELITDHTYIIGRGPVQSIGNVQVGGYPAPAGIYTAWPNLDPARIVFTQKPYATRFAAGSKFLEMHFDAINPDNTAWQAYKAYDAGDDATAARIDKDHRVLSLQQVTINPDRGAVVKAYLAVEHWESDVISNDYAEVWVEGVGVVGRLSRPNAQEGVTIDAEVDIDHGHSHAIGGEHSHTFHDPTLQSDETPHTHLTESTGVTSDYSPDPGDEAFALNAPFNAGWMGEAKTVYFSGVPGNWAGAMLKFKCNVGGTRLAAAGRFVASGQRQINFGSRVSSSNLFWVRFIAYGDGTYYAKAQVWDVRLSVTTETVVIEAQTGANTQVAISGRNDTTASDKLADDVQSLATQNAPVIFNATEVSTRSYVNLFDLTSYVNFDWGWFSGRDVKVTYQGSVDNKSVYVLHAFFDIEYRPRETFFSDEVTAEVQGLRDDNAGTYSGSALGALTRPDHVLKWLLMVPGALPASQIDVDSYSTAGARLTTKGYTIDGLFRGDATVKDAVKKLALQARIRPFWSAGLAKLAFVEALADWPQENPITAGDCQLNSIQVQRQPASAIVNQVDLFFARAWTNADDGPAGFSQSVRAVDNKSIARFGLRNDPLRFLFDLVRSSTMASDLAAFWVDRASTPSSFYTVNCYLSKFDLEKEDKVILSSTWNRLKKAKLRVLGATRIFGSGKNNSINHLTLLLECLRYILIEHSAADMVRALDALDVSVGKEGEFAEVVGLADLLTTGIGPGLDDEQTVKDALSLIQIYATQLEEQVAVGEVLEHEIGIGIEDMVRVLDDAEGWRQFGFGGGQYGVVGFGGWVVWYNRAPDEVAVSEELIAELISGPMSEAVTVEDGLYLHSGFGCPIGSGFGLSPWGM